MGAAAPGLGANSAGMIAFLSACRGRETSNAPRNKAPRFFRIGATLARLPRLGNGLAFLPGVFRQVCGCAWVSWVLRAVVVPISHTGVVILRHRNRGRAHSALAIIGS